jgi:hypothetical protein
MAARNAPHVYGRNRSTMGKMVEGRMCKGGVDSVWIRTLVAVGIAVQEKGVQREARLV